MTAATITGKVVGTVETVGTMRTVGAAATAATGTSAATPFPPFWTYSSAVGKYSRAVLKKKKKNKKYDVS